MRTKISVKVARTVDRTNAHEVTIIDRMGETTIKTAWTNKGGEGLWVDGDQVMGTSQFRFDGTASIRAYFAARYR